jgi:hypothetical protein
MANKPTQRTNIYPHQSHSPLRLWETLSVGVRRRSRCCQFSVGLVQDPMLALYQRYSYRSSPCRTQMTDGTELSERMELHLHVGLLRQCGGSARIHQEIHILKLFAQQGTVGARSVGLARKQKTEASAAFVSIGGNESTTMCGDDRLANYKADAHAFFLRGEGRLEDSAGIGIPIPVSSASTTASSFERRDRTMITTRRIDRVNCIRNQVQKDLLDLYPVGRDFRHVRTKLQMKMSPPRILGCITCSTWRMRRFTSTRD